MILKIKFNSGIFCQYNKSQNWTWGRILSLNSNKNDNIKRHSQSFESIRTVYNGFLGHFSEKYLSSELHGESVMLFCIMF